MPVPINADLLKSLIEARYGSVDDFAVAWEERVKEKQQRRGQARDRNTIYRWLSIGIPSRVDDLYGICGALDIDPVSLLPLNEDFIASQFAKERLRIQINPSRRTDLAPFDPIFMPGVHWPSDEVSNYFYGRKWSVDVREHDPRLVSGVYAAFNLHAYPEQVSPLVFHFAWRRTNALDQMWRPYGTVVRNSNEILLVSESGDFQRVAVQAAADPTTVETFFGAGPAMIKVASLHSFSLSVDVPSRASQAVRFQA
ncbi:MAG: hypothetical protein ACK46Q_07550 [Hyphomonas sp.]